MGEEAAAAHAGAGACLRTDRRDAAGRSERATQADAHHDPDPPPAGVQGFCDGCRVLLLGRRRHQDKVLIADECRPECPVDRRLDWDLDYLGLVLRTSSLVSDERLPTGCRCRGSASPQAQAALVRRLAGVGEFGWRGHG
ncbi:hypothetical protein AB0H12_41585 [Actinosynnema sp. NPDC023794]